MKSVRAKFVCNGVTDYPENQQKTVSLTPVIDGSEENKSFAKYTPGGSVSLSISYETDAANLFEEGKEYFVDFSPAE